MSCECESGSSWSEFQDLHGEPEEFELVHLFLVAGHDMLVVFDFLDLVRAGNFRR